MKFGKKVIFLCLLISVGFFTTSYSQLSKKEKKALKKEKKKMSPAEFKSLKDKSEQLEEENANLKEQVSELKSRLNKKDERISELESELDNLNNQLKQAKGSSSGNNEPTSNKSKPDRSYPQGVVFKVQIGAFRNSELKKYLDHSTETLQTDKTKDGLTAFTLGTFKDYWEADHFKKYLREMGVKDAWIVPYKNGKRVPLKEVLENAVRRKQSN